MDHEGHLFHIPVMGTGFTLDSALRVAKLGIATVISLVDDRLIERVRRYYARQHGLDDAPIAHSEDDARARRITAWLDLVHDLVARQMDGLRALPLEPGNDKWRHLSLSPETSAQKARFLEWQALPAGAPREALAARISTALRPGDVGVNIMTKLDPPRAGPDGEVRPHLSDAKAALRGFARSRLDGKLVLSAGINPGLYSYLEEFPCFSRDADGHIRKPVVLKISDLRSASIQGKFLAKKGIELSELRIESGLNCGGHVFPTEGELLGPIVEQVIAERERFPQIFEPLLEQHAAAHGRTLHQGARNRRIPITVQGGVGNQGEMRRLLEGYGVDAVGWASPFLLVPEVVLLDARTRAQLEAAGADELYVSDASPLGVRFNNLRGSSSAEWQRARIEAGTPGSGCPNGYVANNAEFSERPICTGSSDYQKRKLQALGYATPPKWSEAGDDAKAVYAKECICQHLGNGTLQALGLVRTDLPVAVCPGPNLAYFDRSYSLEEMVDHIYGRRESLVPADRPHLFAKELDLYLAHYRELERTTSGPRAARSLRAFREGLLSGLAHYRALCERPAYPGENLASLGRAVEEAAAGLALVPSLLAQEERSART